MILGAISGTLFWNHDFLTKFRNFYWQKNLWIHQTSKKLWILDHTCFHLNLTKRNPLNAAGLFFWEFASWKSKFLTRQDSSRYLHFHWQLFPRPSIHLAYSLQGQNTIILSDFFFQKWLMTSCSSLALNLITYIGWDKLFRNWFFHAHVFASLSMYLKW